MERIITVRAADVAEGDGISIDDEWRRVTRARKGIYPQDRGNDATTETGAPKFGAGERGSAAKVVVLEVEGMDEVLVMPVRRELQLRLVDSWN